MLFWIQLRNEFWKLFARKRTYIGFGAFLAAEITVLTLQQVPIVRNGFCKRLNEMFTLLGVMLPSGSRNALTNAVGTPNDYYMGITLALGVVVYTFLLMGGLYLSLVSGDIVAKEVEEGTLRMILSRPVSRLRLLWIKWLACIAYTMILVFFIAGTSLLLSVITSGGLGNKVVVFSPIEKLFGAYDTAEGLWRFTRAILLLSLTIQAISTMGFMFSCFNMKPAAATITTLSIFFVDFILRNMPHFQDYQKYFVTYHTACWARTLAWTTEQWNAAGISPEIFRLSPTPVVSVSDWHSIWVSFGYLIVLNFLLFGIGVWRFCTRDFKS